MQSPIVSGSVWLEKYLVNTNNESISHNISDLCQF